MEGLWGSAVGGASTRAGIRTRARAYRAPSGRPGLHALVELLHEPVKVVELVGAGAAAKLVTLETVSRCMPAGILIGVVVLIFSLQHELLPAYALLMLIGVMGGFFVVPLNALLQERGKKSVGAGNAIAVQNLGENSAMLLMLGIYSLAVMIGIPVVPIGIGFGALFALAITALWIWQRRH